MSLVTPQPSFAQRDSQTSRTSEHPVLVSTPLPIPLHSHRLALRSTHAPPAVPVPFLQPPDQNRVLVPCAARSVTTCLDGQPRRPCLPVRQRWTQLHLPARGEFAVWSLQVGCCGAAGDVWFGAEGGVAALTYLAARHSNQTRDQLRPM
jgi:hypothetical protein